VVAVHRVVGLNLVHQVRPVAAIQAPAIRVLAARQEIEMKTANELADEFPEQNPCNFEYDAAIRLNEWGIEAVDMIRSQAIAIDALTALTESLKLQRDALAADAGRVRECASRLVEHADFKLGGILSADSKSKDVPSKATSSVKARHLAALRDALNSSDAMKGKS
jgi:hypothetical protein